MAAFILWAKPTAKERFVGSWQELSKSHASVRSVEELTLTSEELVPANFKNTARLIFCSLTDKLCGRMPAPNCTMCCASTRSKQLTSKDDDVQVNFAEQAQSQRPRGGGGYSAPVTLDEPWTAFVPGEVMVFRDGVLL
jgi:glutamine amidotransferase